MQIFIADGTNGTKNQPKVVQEVLADLKRELLFCIQTLYGWECIWILKFWRKYAHTKILAITPAHLAENEDRLRKFQYFHYPPWIHITAVWLHWFEAFLKARQQAQNHNEEIALHSKFNFNRLYLQEEKYSQSYFAKRLNCYWQFSQNFWTPL